MSKKILISEDYECVSLSIVNALKKYNAEIEQVRNCDEAYEKIKISIKENTPYDLLILDLMYSFNSESVKIKDGLELLSLLKLENISIKILIFSSICNPFIIKKYYDNYIIHGFVSKGPEDLKELETAFHLIFNGEVYYPECIKDKSDFLVDIKLEDEKILDLLNEGFTVKEIAEYFEKRNIHPSNPRTLEKRVESLCKKFGVKNIRELLNEWRKRKI